MTTSNKPNFSTARTVRGSMVIRDAEKGQHISIAGNMDWFEVEEHTDGGLSIHIHLTNGSATTVIGHRRTPRTGAIPV